MMLFSGWYLSVRTDISHRKALSNDTWSCDGVTTGQRLNVAQTRNCWSRPLTSVEDWDCTRVVLEQHLVRLLY